MLPPRDWAASQKPSVEVALLAQLGLPRCNLLVIRIPTLPPSLAQGARRICRGGSRGEQWPGRPCYLRRTICHKVGRSQSI